MKKFAFVIICLFLLNLSQFAQNNLSENHTRRIAFYSKYSFYYDRFGIKRLVEAERLLYDCDFSIQPLLDKIREVENQLKLTSISNEQRKEKEKEYEIVKLQLKNHKDARLENIEKRKKIILQPVWNEINNAINTIEKENNVIFVDLNELEEQGLLLSLDESIDLSKPLISFINNYLDKKTDSIPKFNTSEIKFAKINTEKFYDENNGIKELVRVKKEQLLPIKNINQKIGKELENFRKEKGLSFSLDSSKEIPNLFKNLHSNDITKEFIIRYNQKNQ